MSVPVLEPVFDGTSSSFDEGRQFIEHARRVVGVQTVGPTFRIGGHLLGGKAHDRSNVLTHECAGEIPRRMGRVDDCRTGSEQVLISLTGTPELRLDRPAPGLECLKLANPLAQRGQFGCDRLCSPSFRLPRQTPQ
jgi:hypothetical protein